MITTTKSISDFAERRATWLELFFDLVFVVAVSTLSHLLSNNLTIRELVYFTFLFIPVWWIWMGFSYYSDQFEKDSFVQRLAIFVSMFGVIILANTIPGAMDAQIRNFVITYVLLRILLIVLYVITWYQYPKARSLTMRYIVGFVVGALIWLISIFFSIKHHLVLWGLALFIEMATPVLAYLTAKNIPKQRSHMDERFGLFTLIVLGDTIVSVAIGIENVHWNFAGVIDCIAGFFCAISMWKLYFDYADDKVIHRALRGGKLLLFRSFIYGYSHFLIFFSIVVFGVGIVAGAEAANINNVTRFILFSSPVIYISGITLIQFAAGKYSNEIFITRLIAIAIILIMYFAFNEFLMRYSLLFFAIIFAILSIKRKGAGLLISS